MRKTPNAEMQKTDVMAWFSRKKIKAIDIHEYNLDPHGGLLSLSREEKNLRQKT